MDSFFISVPEEFSFDLCMEFLRRSPRELMHTCHGTGVTKLLRINGHAVLFQLLPGNSGIEVKFLNGTFSAEIRKAVEAYIRDWFDLSTDLKPFYALVQKDKVLSKLVKQFHGYRIIGQPDLFESVIWAVLGQQINLAFAYTLKQRFVENFGEQILHESKAYYLFPQAVVVSGLSESQLIPLQFSRQKSKYVIGLGEAFAFNQISKEALASMSFTEAKERLMKIKGIGNWTANYVLMKTFRYAEAFPLEDAGLHNAIKNQWKLARKPTLDEVKKFFKKYKGWEAYATLYLWKSL